MPNHTKEMETVGLPRLRIWGPDSSKRRPKVFLELRNYGNDVAVCAVDAFGEPLRFGLGPSSNELFRVGPKGIRRQRGDEYHRGIAKEMGFLVDERGRIALDEEDAPTPPTGEE